MNQIKVLTVDELIALLEEFSLAGRGQLPVWAVSQDLLGGLTQEGVVGLEEHADSLEFVLQDDFRAPVFAEQYEELTGKQRLLDL